LRWALGAFTVSLGLLAFMVGGAIAVVAYNLELFGGVIHNSAGVALAWGGLPAITGYWINALALRPAGGARRARLRLVEPRAAAPEHPCPRAAPPHDCADRTSALQERR
jgi:hypothetical protein